MTSFDREHDLRWRSAPVDCANDGYVIVPPVAGCDGDHGRSCAAPGARRFEDGDPGVWSMIGQCPRCAGVRRVQRARKPTDGPALCWLWSGTRACDLPVGRLIDGLSLGTWRRLVGLRPRHCGGV